MPDARRAARRGNIRRLLAPQCLAFIGGARAAAAIAVTRGAGYAGRIYAVHPKLSEMEGVRCFPTVADLPEAPDAAFLVTPIEASLAAVEGLARMGAGAAVCYASGFAELGARGEGLQAALVEASGEMALVGPNCFGVINYVNAGSMWPAPYPAGNPGNRVAMIAQSGNLCINLSASQRSVPWSYIISVGNQAALGVEDFLATLVDDPAVRVIGVFLEGLRDVAGFHEAALRAAERDIPVVVLKSGISRAGARLAFTHTSSIAGSDAMYDALFARTGVIRVRSVPELQEQVKLLAVWGARPGRRLVAFSTSGGDSGMAADFADAAGLELPQPDAAQAASLRAALPDYGAVSNPLDFTATFWGQEEPLRGLFTTLMERGTDKAVLVLDGPRGGEFAGSAADAMTRALIAARDATGVPAATASVMPDSTPLELRVAMLQAGVVPLQGVHDAMRVIAAATGLAEWRARFSAAGPPPPLAPPARLDEAAAVMLDEQAAKAALAQHGLTVPKGQVARLGAVGATAAAIGFPVAVKALHGALAHKTEAGGVVLGLADAVAAEAAGETIRAAVARHSPGVTVDEFLVERMAPRPVCELIVGIQRDPAFGLCLVVGAGGILVELLRAATTLLLPVRRVDVEAVLREGVTGRLLGGFRGGPPGDVQAAVDAVMAVARFAAANHDRLIELDVNPLLVLPQGQGAVAVDALVRIAGAPR